MPNLKELTIEIISIINRETESRRHLCPKIYLGSRTAKEIKDEVRVVAHEVLKRDRLGNMTSEEGRKIITKLFGN